MHQTVMVARTCRGAIRGLLAAMVLGAVGVACGASGDGTSASGGVVEEIPPGAFVVFCV